MPKMASHVPFGHLQLKLWAKEGLGVKLPVWLPTTKSWESTSSRRRLKEYDIALESSQWELKLWYRPCPDPSWGQGAMSIQSPRTPTWDNFGTPLWESWEKKPFACSLRGETQRILYGGRWWLPPSPGRGESCVSKCLWLVPTPKSVPECELTLCGWFLDADSSSII
jgi:hypothetical protein